MMVLKNLFISPLSCLSEMWMIAPQSSCLNFTEVFGRTTKEGPNTLDSNMTLCTCLKEGGERFVWVELTPADQYLILLSETTGVAFELDKTRGFPSPHLWALSTTAKSQLVEKDTDESI